MIELLARVKEAVRTRQWNLRARLRLSGAGVRFGQNLRCQGLPIVSLAPNSGIAIGSHVVLCSDSRYTALGTRIAKGVSIGDNSVIGAGSVVVREIPANVVAAGNPASVIRRLSVAGAETGGA